MTSPKHYQTGADSCVCGGLWPCRDDTRLLFVGECRSLTAQRKGWTWKDGRLAAKPLFEALEAMGVDPKAHKYMNLWTDNATPLIAYHTPAIIKRHQSDGYVIVALGKRVSGELVKRGVDHVALVHPAARGKIRKRGSTMHSRQTSIIGPERSYSSGSC